MTATNNSQRPPLLTPSFTALLVANVCFGYAFSSFFLLPKFMANELGAGPARGRACSSLPMARRS